MPANWVAGRTVKMAVPEKRGDLGLGERGDQHPIARHGVT